MPLRVARQDRRWKGSCGRNLVPEPVWCKERQHPLGRCAWGVRSAADTRPGVAVTGSLVCTQPCLLDTVAVRTSLSIDSSLGAGPWPWRRAWIFTCCMCCALSTYDLNTKNRTSPPLPDLQSPHDSARRPHASCQRFRPGTQRARPFQQPHTHSCSSRLFLTVPRHHSA